MSSQARDWPRLARYVVARRRRDLGLTQDEVKAAGGPSTATQRNIEGALQDSYKPHVLSSLERVLRWGPGSIEAILDGGEPTVLPGAGSERDVFEQMRELREWFEQDNARRDREHEERLRQLEEEIERLKGQQPG